MFSVSRAATIIVATTALVASIGTSEPLPSSQNLSRSMSSLVLNEEVAADMTFPDDGVWIEIDEALYSEINSGNTDRLDLYLDPLSGVQEDRLLRDFPTRHNLDVAGQAIEERGSAEVQSRGSEIGADVQVERVGTRIEKNPHGCHLLPYGTKGVSGGVMYMHRRTDSGSSKYGIIGWKPYTRCVTAPAEIKHENLYYRTTVLGLWYPQASGATGIRYNSKTFDQKNVTWRCKNTKTEDWMGRTIGTVRAKNGKIYAAQQHTQVYVGPCGI